MAKNKPGKKDRENKNEKPKVNPELKGFDIRINQFGEIKNAYDIDKINQFLNKHVDDKKLRDRDDVDRGDGETEKKKEK